VSQAAQQHGILPARHRLADGKFFDCQPIIGRCVGPFGGSKQVHGDQVPEGLDVFEIKNLADPSNKAANIARRRGKHSIALCFTPVTFRPI
jgi:hypothetical protein